MDLNAIRELVEKDEEELFEGCFSEKRVRFDLSTRRNVKRDQYIQYFNKFMDDHRNIIILLERQPSRDTELIEKSKKCKNEADRLLDIVYSY